MCSFLGSGYCTHIYRDRLEYLRWSCGVMGSPRYPSLRLDHRCTRFSRRLSFRRCSVDVATGLKAGGCLDPIEVCSSRFPGPETFPFVLIPSKKVEAAALLTSDLGFLAIVLSTMSSGCIYLQNFVCPRSLSRFRCWVCPKRDSRSRPNLRRCVPIAHERRTL